MEAEMDNEQKASNDSSMMGELHEDKTMVAWRRQLVADANAKAMRMGAALDAHYLKLQSLFINGTLDEDAKLIMLRELLAIMEAEQ